MHDSNLYLILDHYVLLMPSKYMICQYSTPFKRFISRSGNANVRYLVCNMWEYSARFTHFSLLDICPLCSGGLSATSQQHFFSSEQMNMLDISFPGIL
jgi:hypothetical protein